MYFRLTPVILIRSSAAMALPLVNQSIWLSDKQEGWIPATVKDIDGHTGSVTVKMQSGEEIMLPRSSYSQFLVGSPPSDAAAAPRVTQRRKSQLSRRQSFASSRDKKYYRAMQVVDMAAKATTTWIICRIYTRRVF